MDKISVVVPVYNSEKYLQKCIDSILNQSFTNIEVLLVDDGSSDKSMQICRQYSEQDNRVKVFYKENSGVSDTRNFGLDKSSGNYIVFIDSDDWIDKEYLNVLYKNLINYDADVSVCNFTVGNDQNKSIKVTSNNKNIELSNIEAINEIYGDLYFQIISVVWNKLYKKELFNDLRFPVGKIHEDEYITPLILYKCRKIVYTDKELLYYRQTPNSIMNSKFNIKRLDYLYVLENRIEFFKENMLDQLYEKSIETYILKIIDFYFKVKYSDIKNKKNINKILIEKLDSIDNQWDVRLTKSLRKNLNLFKRYPYLYEIKICIAKLLIKLKYNIKGREF